MRTKGMNKRLEVKEKKNMETKENLKHSETILKGWEVVQQSYWFIDTTVSMGKVTYGGGS